jgi:hypothetical protein
MNEPATRTRGSSLALTALRFAAGDLPPEQAAAFAEQMTTDPDAQDALERAFRLSAAALGQSPPTPECSVRDAVADHVRRPLLSKWLPHRRYRGHPLAWVGVGGGFAAGLAVVGIWLADAPDDDPPTGSTPARVEEFNPSQATRVKVVDPNGGPAHTAVVKEMDERSGMMVVELVPDEPAEDAEKSTRGGTAVEVPPTQR